ncbi:hypothetical protein FRZ61_27680 [Hypericibacter adhaerens]|uniref:Golvesin/Xly CBD-like domain-containing protein n=1 Tax=Hypericibacter adhaerens TaxID=2602016 RepID=A0A5J6N1K7_9PROT|nr:RHS repeat-associated core domain-containing protein [Hypericibacter adhaerens]QEX22835.1 hypothetical protein FRZ61_27680 [Hypericibacter adhaerens]
MSYEGGSTTVTVNQRVSGGQWVLLGTYPFNASGTGYKVDLADTSLTGKVVADAIYYVQDGAPVDSFTWTPTISSAGEYQLYARWTASSANSGAAQYTVVHDGGTSLVTASQKQNGGQWNLLGTWNFAPSAGHQVTLTASSDGNVVADAIKLVGTGPAPADLVYLHSDQIGLPQKITDAAQAVVWDRIQDPFGRQVSLTSSGGIDTSLRFPGQQADPDTGFSYNYFRDYDPTLGRYIQADPIGLAGGINRYAYAKNNPPTYKDPFGLDVLLCRRPADLPFPMNLFDHYWIKTDKYEAGMGGMAGQVPAQGGRSDWPYDPTQTVDHSGQSKSPNATCEKMNNVDEQCVNSLIRPGQPTGPWEPFNQCQSFAWSVIGKCRYGPQIIPSPVLPQMSPVPKDPQRTTP